MRNQVRDRYIYEKLTTDSTIPNPDFFNDIDFYSHPYEWFDLFVPTGKNWNDNNIKCTIEDI